MQNLICQGYIQVVKKFGLLFFNFCLFPLSKFQMTIVKNLIMDFEGSNEFLLCHKYFWSTHFWQWNAGPFKTFWNLHGNASCFFIFSKWNITTSLLMIHLKCTVAHYANLKFKDLKQAIFKLRAIHWICYFVFSISYLCLF